MTLHRERLRFSICLQPFSVFSVAHISEGVRPLASARTEPFYWKEEGVSPPFSSLSVYDKHLEFPQEKHQRTKMSFSLIYYVGLFLTVSDK